METDLVVRARPAVGPTVDDLATALSDIPGVTFRGPTPGIYLYDMDGTRLVIVANYTDERRAELDAMLESIRFD